MENIDFFNGLLGDYPAFGDRADDLMGYGYGDYNKRVHKDQAVYARAKHP